MDKFVNVLLSFAQFEREVTSERIRDKIAASKKKGMWMGGPVPLGYDLGDRKLIINETEAQTVRHIFTQYSRIKSVPKLVDELAAQDIRTKQRRYKDGRTAGGIAFGRGPLTALLQNPIYSGKIRHKDELYDGEHEAIIEQQLFDEVQHLFAANRRDNALGKKSRNPSLLTGMITDPDGRPMTPVHTSKGPKRYRYYVTRFKPVETTAEPWRLPSGEIERLVIAALSNHLGSGPYKGIGDATELAQSIDRDKEVANQLLSTGVAEKRKRLLELKTKVQVKKKQVDITIQPDGSRKHETISVAAELTHRGPELKLTVAAGQGLTTQDPDPVLLRLIAHAFAARNCLVSGAEERTVESYSTRYLHQLVRISYLAPDIISAIVNGSQPVDLTGRRLLRVTSLPLCWAGQRAALGFETA